MCVDLTVLLRERDDVRARIYLRSDERLGPQPAHAVDSQPEWVSRYSVLGALRHEAVRSLLPLLLVARQLLEPGARSGVGNHAGPPPVVPRQQPTRDSVLRHPFRLQLLYVWPRVEAERIYLPRRRRHSDLQP